MKLGVEGLHTHQNLKVTPHRKSLFTFNAFITPCDKSYVKAGPVNVLCTSRLVTAARS